ncbi:MAG: PAS domain-containing protein [Verrucomicrobiota bacterium]
MLDTIREPVLLLDLQQRVQAANPSFCRTFQIAPEDALNRSIYDLAKHQWNIPKLRELLEQRLPPSGQIEDFEITQTFQRLGQKTLLLNARQFEDRVVLAIEDVTAQRRHASSESPEYARQLADIETIYNTAHVGLCVIDRDLRYLRINQFMADMNEASVADHLGKTVRDILPSSADAADALAQKVFTTGQPVFDVEFNCEAHPGKHRVFLTHWLPLKNEAGAVTSINVVTEDITERKRAEEILRRSESQFRGLTEDIPQLVWTCNADYEFDYLSPQWADYTGVPVCEHLGTKWIHAVHPEDQPKVWDVCRAAKEHGKQFLLEYRLRHKSGVYRWFKVAALPIRDSEGKVIKWFGTSTDIDDQKNYAAHLEQTVRERTTRLRQAMGELESFSYSIAHDMRAPLRAMQSFAGVLTKKFAGTLEPEAAGYISRISKAANRLDRLIQDTLSYTRIVRGNVPMEPVNVDKLLRDIIAGQPEWQLPRADVLVEGTLPIVWANEAYLTQAISNVLSNAVKFVAKETLPRIRIWAESTGTDVRLWFQDNGIGIELDNQKRIFKLLDRVHPDADYEGTGLGLAIVRKAVERMNGTVGVESQPGQGSRFWIRLKRAKN